ncbi:MAG: GLPGLI family protein [Pseudobacter sp.]|uniref:GLPGLI family protein n=1 Tax=Pseudobacter sp. TaxID=2045420 RepID=UPI003F8003B8
MKNIILSILFLTAAFNGMTQDFLSVGRIEYEKKVNLKRAFAEFSQNFKQSGRTNAIAIGGGGGDGPEFMTIKKEILFSGDKILYRGIGEQGFHGMGGTNVTVFTDLQERKSTFKTGFGESFVFEDSLKFIRWQIGDETRSIAGFKCRKAIGVMMDSVYVVAFYCPEILPQGGPEYFNGLPGMILGLAIPRLHTTWFATKIQITGVDEKLIVAPAPSKKEKVLTMQEARAKQKKDMGFILKDGIPNEVLDSNLKGINVKGMFDF